jgi:quinol monooxygenase YgiN
MSQPIRVVAHATARPETREEIRSILTGFLEPTRAEEGCIEYELFEDLDEPLKFTMVERWSSREALNTHLQTPHLAAGIPRLAALVDGPIVIQVLGKVG